MFDAEQLMEEREPEVLCMMLGNRFAAEGIADKDDQTKLIMHKHLVLISSMQSSLPCKLTLRVG